MGLEQPAQSTAPKKRRRQKLKQNTKLQSVVPVHSLHDSKTLEHSVPKISLQTQLDYARRGHAVLRLFLPAGTIQNLQSELLPYAKSHELDAWRQKVEVQLADSSDAYYQQNARSLAKSLKTIDDCRDMMESLGMDRSDLPFMQHFNIWRDENANAPALRNLCLSPYMAQSASILLDSPTVRLYQDSLFHKRPGDGWTPYHSVSAILR